MLRLFRRLSITVQLVLVICVVIVPMIILLLISSSVIVKNVEKHMINLYNFELESFSETVETALDEIEEDTLVVYKEHYGVFSSSALPNRISRIRIMEDLANIWKRVELLGGVALHIPDTGEIYLSHDREKLSYHEVEAMKNVIRQMEVYSGTGNMQILADATGKYYCMISYLYGKSHVVYFIPCKTILLSLLERSYGEDIEIYLVNSQDKVISSVDGELGEIKVSEKDHYVIQQDIPGIGIRIIFIIEKMLITGAIPASLIILRYACISVVLLLPLLWAYIRRSVLKFLNSMNGAMRELERDNLDYRLDWENAEFSEAGFMERSFNGMAEQIKRLRIEKYEMELKKRDVEIMNLRLQINPHLLLNSLTMIHSLAKTRNYETIQKYTISLSRYFRYTLRNTAAMVTLKEEMDFVESYLDIQKIRYPGVFSYVYNIEEGLEQARVPSLIIENFVENTVKYALKPESETLIVIIVRAEGENMIVSIVDDGKGMSQERLLELEKGQIIQDKYGSHIGIWNIRRRLQMIYGEKAHLSISSKSNEGTQIWLKMPLQISDETGGINESVDCG